MLHRLTILTLLILATASVVQAAPAAVAGIPPTLNYQGQLTQANGEALSDGFYDLTYRLWDNSTGGNLLWSETGSIELVDGVFSTVLGSQNPLNAGTGVDFEQHLWLGIEVASDGELQPRLALTSTPYSFIAAEVADGAAVRSLNGLQNEVNLVPGANVTITPSGNNLILNASGGGGGTDNDWGINGDQMYALPGGNVGIGTTDPGHHLHVVGDGGNGTQFKLEDNTSTGEQSYQIATMWVQTALALGQLSMTTTNSGNKTMLLRAQTPGSDLVLESAAETQLKYGSRLQIRNNGADVAEFNDDNELILFDGADVGVMIRAGNPVGTLDGGEMRLSSPFGVETVRLDGYQDGSRGGTITLYGEANNKAIALHGQKNLNNEGGYAEFYDENGQRTLEMRGQNNLGGGGEFLVIHENGIRTLQISAQEDGSATQGSALKMYNDSGQQTIELDADYGSSNQSRITTDVLEITGGSDLSEQFDIGSHGPTVEPGHVVCINPASPGELQLSTEAYDTRVAGVVSGAGGVRPGMLMGQRGSAADGAHPVALTGRVYVKVDASSGPVVPGDLLTTSGTPGHAMKVPEATPAPGAILGKAMTGLASGRGLVLVLVTLQ